MKYILLALAAFPMIATLSIGCFFALTRPDRLQSEEYVIRQTELSIIARKGATTLANEPTTADDIYGLETGETSALPGER